MELLYASLSRVTFEELRKIVFLSFLKVVFNFVVLFLMIIATASASNLGDQSLD